MRRCDKQFLALSSYATQNKAQLLDVASHVAKFNQFKCFVPAKRS